MSEAAVSEPLPASSSIMHDRMTLFNAEPYFVMRTPIFPASRWLNLLDRSRDRVELADALRSEWESSWVQEAVFLASPSLHQRLSDWDWSLRGKKDHKLLLSFYSYYSRMCTRATPFGLFAAVSCGRVGQVTNLEVADQSTRLRRHTRLDTALVAALAEKLAGHPDLRTRLNLRLNDCGHARGDRWQYVEWTFDNQTRRYSLSAADLTEPLREILERVGPSGIQFPKLVRWFHENNPEIARDEIIEFILCLVDNKLLLPSLEPQLTGEECLPAMLRQLKRIDDSAPGVSELIEVERLLKSMDRTDPARSMNDLRAIETVLKPLNAPLNRDRLVQVDLYRDAPNLELSQSVVDEIAIAAELSLTLSAMRNNRLDNFCQRFTQRYEGRRVALLEALDEETGIGEGNLTETSSPLLEGVSWRPLVAGRSGDIDEMLVDRWLAASADSTDEIELDPSEVQPLTGELRARVPHAVHAMVTLLGDSAAAIERGDFQIWLQGFSGPSVANMLGRFCFGNTELVEQIRCSLKREAESQPDAIFAEIVHLPQERLGNLACRPLLRDYEIPVLGRSGADSDHQIQLNDLDIEVQGTEITLWSRRLNRRVIPRMSNAHNFEANSLGLYRFLCLLQFHGSTSGLFRPGPLLSSRTHVPRIRCGRVILSPAQWNLDRAKAKALLDISPERILEAIGPLRADLRIPRHVGLVKADNVLALDLENQISLDALVAALCKNSRIQLVELFVGSSDLCAGNSVNKFSHELVVPMIRRSDTGRKPTQIADRKARNRTDWQRYIIQSSPQSSELPDAVRTRLPGSDWLSYRLFGGAALLDRALAELLAPAASQWVKEDLCAHWFFIRYNDPTWHLRLRFHGQPELLAGQIIPRMRQLSEEMMRQGMIDRVEIATYQREVERYGGPDAMTLCERWFASESQRIGALLGRVRGGDPNWRWQLAIVCLMQDLADFGLEADQTLDLFEFVAEGFCREFHMEKGRLATLGSKYRDLAESVWDACQGQLPEGLPESDVVQAVILSGAEERRAIGSEIRQLGQQGRLWGTVESLLPSLLHMACNRWFVDTSRANEMVLYDMVRRGLTSLRAQGLGPWGEATTGQVSEAGR